MNTSAIKRFKQALSANQPVFGLWVTLESASITEMAVALGVDWVVVDAEHGHLDWKEILHHVRAAVRSHTVVLVRIAELNIGLIKRALDIGADGVVVPWMESVEQLRQAVAFAHYPPEGLRGMGGERATCWGRCLPQNVTEADENVLVVPIIESVRGGRNIEALCQVNGVDVFFLGPADFSSTAGYPGQWEGPGVAEQLLHVKDTVRRHGKHCGVMATSNENLSMRLGQGFRMMALGMDAGLLLRGLTGALAAVGRDAAMQTSFAPVVSAVAADPAPRTDHGAARNSAAIAPMPAQASAAPTAGRSEIFCPVKAAARVELTRGVVFRPLVGANIGACGLTTGIVQFMPGARLPYHMHSFSESVTVVTGRLAFEVMGRRYVLGPLDHIRVPAGLAHQAENPSPNQPATVHIAMASDSPTRTLVETAFASRPMPQDSRGDPAGERISRHVTHQGAAPACPVEFQELFSAKSGASDLSGGRMELAPGARTVCSALDHDASLTVVQGAATCLADGRCYPLSDGATVFCPAGVSHAVENPSAQPALLIWVCAGGNASRQTVALVPR